jgi:hypothetical protein
VTVRHASSAQGALRVAGVGIVAVLMAKVLHRYGDGVLAGPPLTEPGRWSEWAAARDPLTAAMAMVRIGAIGVCGYVAAVVLLGGIARLARPRAGLFASVVDRVTVPIVRRLLVGVVVEASIAGAAVAPAGLLVADTGRGDLPVDDEVPVEADPSSTDGTATMRVVPQPTADGITMHRLPDVSMKDAPSNDRDPPGPARTTTTTEVAQTPGAALASAPDASSPSGQSLPAGSSPRVTWTLAPGEHLWAVAEAHIADTWGRLPTDAEVTPYWVALVEGNRDRLADPANPDLVFPGQVVDLPAVPPPP